MKKTLSLILALCFAVLSVLSVSAASIEVGSENLQDEFSKGVFRVENGVDVDYRYFAPSTLDGTKYPLVIWLHGMGDGANEGKQLTASNISYWASDEFQARFTNGGAFIFVPRSDETKGICWNDNMIEPLKAAIDAFIAENEDNIDLTRIYVGGYSMGGKMTLKMAIAYPEMFAAAFPICPAWSPDSEALSFISDMPVWITSGKTDPLVNYYFSVSKTFEKLCAVTNVPEKVRFSSLSRVCYEDGKRTMSAHHAWFAVNHDMFSSENGDYPYMSTVNGLGETVTLTYPDGIISWLCSHTSDYEGQSSSGKGNLDIHDGGYSMIGCTDIFDFFKTLFSAIVSLFSF